MPLDNTASIKDIITSLQNMEGINAKADLASVVGSPATADDSMATINNVIQQAKNDLADKTGQVNTEPLQSLVDNTVIGKKWASGTVTSSSNSLTFSGTGGSNVTARYVEVTGLDFEPSSVMVITNGGFVGSYTSKILPQYNGYNVINMDNSRLRLTAPAYLIDGGFLLPVVEINTDYAWVAYE